MRYKVISLAIAVLLMATPVFAQKSVPILTQTLKTTNPTTVITGQTLKQTYFVRFIDLTHKGEEIIIKKEDLDLKTLGEFEVLNLQIDYDVKQEKFLEHRWYLNYTLRIINPQKGPKIISSFVVPWKLKKIGQQDDDLSVQYDYDLKTEEVHLNYVTTIPAKDPHLAIMDQMDFGTFGISGWVLKYVSWFLAIVPMSVWLVLFVWRLRSSGARSHEEENLKAEESDSSIKTKGAKVSLWKARRQLRKAITRLNNMGTGRSSDSASRVMPELYGALMDFLRIKVPYSTIGTTGTEMLLLVEKMKNGSGKKALSELAEKAAYYQNCIEKETPSNYWPNNPIDDVKILRKSLKKFSWYMTVIGYPASILSRRR